MPKETAKPMNYKGRYFNLLGAKQIAEIASEMKKMLLIVDEDAVMMSFVSLVSATPKCLGH